MVGSLNDNSTETFWESCEEDRNKCKWVMVSVKEASAAPSEAAAAARPTDNGPLQSLWETVLLVQLDSGLHEDPQCVVAL